jgi:hypothetical protein
MLSLVRRFVKYSGNSAQTPGKWRRIGANIDNFCNDLSNCAKAARQL